MAKGHKGTFWDDGKSPYFNCGGKTGGVYNY